MLKVGFVGLGAISHENVLGYVGSPDAAVTAVCSRSKEKADSWVKQYGFPEARHYPTLEAMLEKETLDIVELLSPHHLHHPQAVACAQAKVGGISLQKPMALTLRECDDIIEQCAKNDVRLKVYENFVFYPVYLKAKELIGQGLIGELISIRVNTMTGLKEGAPWPWCFSPDTWRADIKTSGVGPLVGDDGYHKFSLTRWFMERDMEKISSWIDADTPLDAPALIRAKFKPLPGDHPKYAQIDFFFSPRMALPCDFWLDDFVEIVGARGIMWINQCSAGGNRQLFRGNKMSDSPVFPPIAVFVDGQVTAYLEDISPSERNWSSSFIASTKHFIEAMKNGGDPIYSGEEGREITRYGMAALVAAQENRDVYLDEITSETEQRGEFKITENFCNL